MRHLLLANLVANMGRRLLHMWLSRRWLPFAMTKTVHGFKLLEAIVHCRDSSVYRKPLVFLVPLEYEVRYTKCHCDRGLANLVAHIVYERTNQILKQ